MNWSHTVHVKLQAYFLSVCPSVCLSFKINVLNYKIPTLLLHLYLGQSSHAFLSKVMGEHQMPGCFQVKLTSNWIRLCALQWTFTSATRTKWCFQACAPRCFALLDDTNLKERRKWCSTISHSWWFPYKPDVELVSCTLYSPYDIQCKHIL